MATSTRQRRAARPPHATSLPLPESPSIDLCGTRARIGLAIGVNGADGHMTLETPCPRCVLAHCQPHRQCDPIKLGDRPISTGWLGLHGAVSAQHGKLKQVVAFVRLWHRLAVREAAWQWQSFMRCTPYVRVSAHAPAGWTRPRVVSGLCAATLGQPIITQMV